MAIAALFTNIDGRLPYLAASGTDIPGMFKDISCVLPALFMGMLGPEDDKNFYRRYIQIMSDRGSIGKKRVATSDRVTGKIPEWIPILKEKLRYNLKDNMGYPNTKKLEDMVKLFERLFMDKNMNFAYIKKRLMSPRPTARALANSAFSWAMSAARSIP